MHVDNLIFNKNVPEEYLLLLVTQRGIAELVQMTNSSNVDHTKQLQEKRREVWKRQKNIKSIKGQVRSSKNKKRRGNTDVLLCVREKKKMGRKTCVYECVRKVEVNAYRVYCVTERGTKRQTRGG